MYIKLMLSWGSTIEIAEGYPDIYSPTIIK